MSTPITATGALLDFVSRFIAASPVDRCYPSKASRMGKQPVRPIGRPPCPPFTIRASGRSRSLANGKVAEIGSALRQRAASASPATTYFICLCLAGRAGSSIWSDGIRIDIDQCRIAFKSKRYFTSTLVDDYPP